MGPIWECGPSWLAPSGDTEGSQASYLCFRGARGSGHVAGCQTEQGSRYLVRLQNHMGCAPQLENGMLRKFTKKKKKKSHQFYSSL